MFSDLTWGLGMKREDTRTVPKLPTFPAAPLLHQSPNPNESRILGKKRPVFKCIGLRLEAGAFHKFCTCRQHDDKYSR